MFTVSTGADTGAGSLRQAITDANGNGNDPTIDQIDVDFVGNIDLLSALPQINTSMTITGPGVNALVVRRSASAVSPFRMFSVNPGAGVAVAIQNLTISGVRAMATAGGAMIKSGVGTLVLNSTQFDDNETDGGDGGGVFCDAGTLTIRNTTLSANRAGFGGGMVATTACTAELSNTTVSGNSANDFGGGIYVGGNGHITVNSSTIFGNKADADDSGGGAGGGSYNASGGTAPTFSVANDLYAGNTVGTSGDATATQCGGGMSAPHTSSGYNLRTVADTGCTGFADSTDFVNASPMLGTLQVNVTGPPTIALLTGSPAINAGNPATPGGVYPACPATDERALPRGAFGNRCDIGAYEVQRNTTTTAVICEPSSLTLGSGSTTCTATVTDSGSPSPASTPTGTLNFSSGAAGTFDPTSCPLAALSATEASCQVIYTPSAAGSHVITGAHPGDADHGISQGSAEVVVVAPPAPPSPPAPKATGRRAAALKKCKKKPKGQKRKKCVKRAKRLPV